jgi:hypothetical protein
MAARIEPFNTNPMIVKYLLLVLILPPDSIRASSNMAYLFQEELVTTYRHQEGVLLFPVARTFLERFRKLKKAE